MKNTLFALLLFCITAQAAQIREQLYSPVGASPIPSITFTPLDETPMPDDCLTNGTVFGMPVTVTLTNGLLSTPAMHGGRYEGDPGIYGKKFKILIPPCDTNTYTLRQVMNYATNSGFFVLASGLTPVAATAIADTSAWNATNPMTISAYSTPAQVAISGGAVLKVSTNAGSTLPGMQSANPIDDSDLLYLVRGGSNDLAATFGALKSAIVLAAQVLDGASTNEALRVGAAATNLTYALAQLSTNLSYAIGAGATNEASRAASVVQSNSMTPTLVSNAITGELARNLVRNLVRTNTGMVDVRQDYGAKGDGTNDDTAAFAAGATNSALYVPPGTYKVRPFVLHGSLVGAGQRRTTLMLYAPAENDVIVTAADVGCEVRDITFDGGTNTDRKNVVGVRTTGISHNCIGQGGVTECSFLNLGHGIVITGTNSIFTQPQAGAYTANYFSNCTVAVLAETDNAAEFTQITGSHIYWGTRGIENRSAANLRISQNTIISMSDYAILAVGPPTGTYPNRGHSYYGGNHIGHTHGICVSNANNAFISANIIGGANGNSLVRLYGATNTSITGNWMEMTTGTNVVVAASCGTNTVTGNMLTAGSPAYVAHDGTGCRLVRSMNFQSGQLLDCAEPLRLRPNDGSIGATVSSDSSTGALSLFGGSALTDGSGILLRGTNFPTASQRGMVAISANTAGADSGAGKILFQQQDGNGTWTFPLCIGKTGAVGVGTTTPRSKLTVVGGDIELAGNKAITAFGVGDSSTADAAWGSLYASADGKVRLLSSKRGTSSLAPIVLGTWDGSSLVDILTISTNGNVSVSGSLKVGSPNASIILRDVVNSGSYVFLISNGVPVVVTNTAGL